MQASVLGTICDRFWFDLPQLHLWQDKLLCVKPSFNVPAMYVTKDELVSFTAQSLFETVVAQQPREKHPGVFFSMQL